MMWIRKWLSHPLTRGLELDDPRTTEMRRRIIREKASLRSIYQDWYARLTQALPAGEEPVLELGSGAGFMDEYLSGLITSEIFHCQGVRAVLDGCNLPFPPDSLRAIVMTDVLHHIPDVRRFFHEATRCVRKDGAILMVEPWVSAGSTWFYQNLHHEPFRPDAEEWEFPSSGPLSGANGALPWMLFERDRSLFLQEFPRWRIVTVNVMMPFSYLLSGGVSMVSLVPMFIFNGLRRAEKALQRWNRRLGMFAFICLQKTG